MNKIIHIHVGARARDSAYVGLRDAKIGVDNAIQAIKRCQSTFSSTDRKNLDPLKKIQAMAEKLLSELMSLS